MYKPDLCRSRDLDDVIRKEQEVHKRGEDTSGVSITGVGPDQPSSISETRSEEIQSTRHSRQEVLRDMSLSTGQDRVSEAPPGVDISDREEPAIGENARAQASLDIEESDNLLNETVPTLPSAKIDCNLENNNVEPQPLPDERQRPVRNTNRPPRYRDDAFDMQFQPRPRRRNCRRIQKRNMTGNYVTNKGEWRRLGRGGKQRHVIPSENKEATPIANQKGTTQAAPTTSSQPEKNARRRYPRSHEEGLKSVVSPRQSTNFKDTTSFVKTSKTLWKRLRTAHLRSSLTSPPQVPSSCLSAAMTDVEINKIVINARPNRYSATRPTVVAAAARNQHTAAMPIQKAKVKASTDKNTNETSISDPGKIQIANIDCPKKSTLPDASEVFLQQQHRQVNSAHMQTSLKSTQFATKCRIATTASTLKNKEIIASTENCGNKVHRHRFRCKKRQKGQRTSQRK